jgi:hypothetical protein
MMPNTIDQPAPFAMRLRFRNAGELQPDNTITDDRRAL